jgi:hypothetical protein
MTKRGLTHEERFWMKVNKTAGCWSWIAGKNPAGYGTVHMADGKKYAHRVSWELTVGPIPDGLDIDHICHNHACVNPGHLRTATRKQNMENRIAPHANSKTGVRGVFWSKAKRKYCARVAHNRRIYHAGYFESIVDAEKAAIAKRLELFTHNIMDR